MLDVLFSGVVMLLKALGVLLLAYMFYWRVIDYAHCVYFYGR